MSQVMVPPAPPRLIAIDLDGTALDSAGGVRPATRRAVKAAIGRGIEVIVVSGRHHAAVRPFHRELTLSTPAICCNGTYVYDFATRCVLAGNPLSREQARWMLDLCRRQGVHCLVYADDVMAFEAVNSHMRRFQLWSETLPTELRPDLRLVVRFEPVIEAALRIWKFVVSHDDSEVLRRWRGEAEAHGGFNIETSWRNRIDVTRAGTTKGRRLIEWAATRGVAPEEILAFGDNQNDLSMLTAVGIGVAMGNAEETVKSAAAMVVGDNDSDAIAETIMRFTA